MADHGMTAHGTSGVQMAILLKPFELETFTPRLRRGKPGCRLMPIIP